MAEALSDNALRCNSCGSERVEATVQFGSYVLRCGACGEHIVATSFIAVLETDHEFSAYLDPGHGQQPASDALIASGPLREISTAIRALVSGGTTVLLVPR